MNIQCHITSLIRRTFPTWLIAGLAALAVVACGPVQSTSRISAAEGELERARINDAHVNSPYEYERAQLYLYKAKQEWGYSNFEQSRDYAAEARRAARAAVDNSQEAPWRGHPIYGYDLPQDIEQLRRDLQEADELDDVAPTEEINE